MKYDYDFLSFLNNSFTHFYISNTDYYNIKP